MKILIKIWLEIKFEEKKLNHLFVQFSRQTIIFFLESLQNSVSKFDWDKKILLAEYEIVILKEKFEVKLSKV